MPKFLQLINIIDKSEFCLIIMILIILFPSMT
jgi:hypothetical protein